MGLLLFSVLISTLAASAQSGANGVTEIRSFESDEAGITNPSGLAYSPEAGVFFVLQADAADQPTVFMVTPQERVVGSVNVDGLVADPINMTFDAHANRLLLWDSATGEIVEMAATEDGMLDSQSTVIRRYQAGPYGVQEPKGMAVDRETGHLYIVDGASGRILQVVPSADSGLDGQSAADEGRLSWIDLNLPASAAPQGVTVDPADDRLLVLSPATATLYRITESGDVVEAYDLATVGLADAQGIVLAPSANTGDAPSLFDLYIADSGQTRQALGRIAEISLSQVVGPAAITTQTVMATLVMTTPTSSYSPPSPDPSGIAYIPDLATSPALLMSDAEVEEMPIWANVNLFWARLNGAQITGGVPMTSTTTFSNEPTGVAYNPANQHLFYSDDGAGVFEVYLGPDKIFGTGDGELLRLTFPESVYNIYDAEGVGYGDGHVYVANGVHGEIVVIGSGTNGIWDGPPSNGGDDTIARFDTASLGITDPEGVDYDPATGFLYIIGKEDVILETTTDGTLVRYIDIRDIPVRRAGGLAVAPASSGSGASNIYIVDRAVDNNVDPDENDGVLHEIQYPNVTPGNSLPVVDAGPNQSATLAAGATLAGSATDDGIVAPLVNSWTQVGGPGLVTFANASLLNTAVTFTVPGIYPLELTSYDGELSASDRVTITVTGLNNQYTTEVRITESSDDVEERIGGANDRQLLKTNADLDMVYDSNCNAGAGCDQKIGVRFPGLQVPQGAIILSAYVQFQVDEVSVAETNLTIKGEKSNSAATFGGSGDLTDRLIISPTLTTVAWNLIPAWTVVGAAGPEQRTADVSGIIQEIVNRPGWSINNALALILTGSGLRTAEAVDGDPAGAPLLRVFFQQDNFNQPPVVNAGVDQIVDISVGATLNGVATDDGNVNPLTITWSKVSGPGTVTFANPSAAATTATFSAAGDYVLRLTANDGEHVSTDDVNITAEAGNQAPQVDAGENQIIVLPNVATLNGTVVDDGQPNGTLVTEWKKATGPGSVSFGDKSSVDTTASFSEPGFYVLRLTADDSALIADGQVTITVRSEGSEPGFGVFLPLVVK